MSVSVGSPTPPPMPPTPFPPSPEPTSSVEAAPGATATATPTASPTIGDGTTLASRTTSRWRAWRWPIAAIVVLVGVTLASTLLGPRTSTIAFAPDNPQPNGARAVAEVLGDRGVTVHFTRSRTEALERARPGTTVLVIGDHILPADTSRDLAASGADLALFEPGAELLEAATGGAVVPAHVLGVGGVERPAGCDTPFGRAVESVTSGGAGYRAAVPGTPAEGESTAQGASEVTLCFPFPDDDGGSGPGAAGTSPAGSYAAMTRADGVRVGIFDDASVLTNERIATAGNAALALWMTGHNTDLVWYLPDPAEFLETTDLPSGNLALLPRPVNALFYLAAALLVTLMIWRGRRLGPVVTEPLPVLVQASEATRGRGRLYRRGRAYGHAGASLRAGAADRLAAKVGLPRSATAEELIHAVHRATGHDTSHIAGLLYGPPPTDDSEFVRLTAALDQLENEVYHP